jgi:hypothetical protein
MLVDSLIRLVEKTDLLLRGLVGRVPRVGAAGVIAGQKIETTVDSEAARYYLEATRLPSSEDQELYARLDALRLECGPSPISRDYFARVAKTFSPDVATLHFAAQVFEAKTNRTFYQAVQEEFITLKALQANAVNARPSPGSYLVLFVPGMHYKAFPETGADFARPRQILTQMGLENALLETDENGTVEKNAELIAQNIIRCSARCSNIILVSASKSGPEAAQALGAVLTAHAAEPVKAWINIGGLLQGSYLADTVMLWPKRWVAKVLFAFRGWNIQSISSITTSRSRGRFERLAIPDHIMVVNYVGVPLSGHITERAVNNYRALRIHGPNDGLSLLSDELVPGALTVLEMGLDHYYKSVDMDTKAAALAYAVIAQLRVFDAVKEMP